MRESGCRGIVADALFIAVLSMAACASSAKPAPANAATPPAGGREALVVIHEMQAEPFREDEPFRAKQAALIKWVEGSPDVTVIVCEGLLPKLDVDARPHDGVLLFQSMFGQAAYLIEHAGAPPRDEAVFTSGLVAAVGAYRKLLVVHPEERQTAWDQLDAAERKNELSPHVRSSIQGCLKP
ncbi:MAG TPA: hypothetical protein VH853_16105 [Polyangia bacterium]|jgi:hypothetical protein|nr:hypothetical protein [Polyangia bacterium]